ncbi:AsmA family protein [Pseudomonas aeruginosa]
MTRGRRILTWSLASLVLLLAALVVFIATFDWNLIKPTLNEKVSAALNRPVRHQRQPRRGLAPRGGRGRLARLDPLAALQRRGHHPRQPGVDGGQDQGERVRQPGTHRIPPRAVAVALADHPHSTDQADPAARRPPAPGRRPRQLGFRPACQRQRRAVRLATGHPRDRFRQGVASASTTSV